MKMKFLACCVLFGLTACGEKPQEQSQVPTQTEVKQEQSQTVEPKPMEQPKVYADETKRLTLKDYIAYDITQIVPYSFNEQLRLFQMIAYHYRFNVGFNDCSDENSFKQTARGMRLQSMGRFTEAKQYYEQAAQKGNAFAENRLGEMYLLGLGVDKDIEQAKYWFERSANTGYYFAQTSLGIIYLDFNLTKQNVSIDEKAGLNYPKSRLENSRVRIGKNADIEKANYWLYHSILQGSGEALGVRNYFFNDNTHIKNINIQDMNKKSFNDNIKIDKASCAGTENLEPLVIIKDNLPIRYKESKHIISKVQRIVDISSSESNIPLHENAIFLGDKVVIRERNPNRVSYQEFVEQSNKVIIAE